MIASMNISDVNLRHLRVIRQVCDSGSLNKAADVLNISQPSISVALGGLERHFDGRLLDRFTAGSAPTAGGQILLVRLERMEAQLAAALGDLLGASAERDHALIDKSLNRITLRQMTSLIALANGMSITETAHKLEVSPASLHRTLHDLQNNIGRSILLRSPAGVAPNAVGRRLAMRWQVALTELDQATDEMREAEGKIEGRIRIASLPLARTRLLARAINPLLARYPKARIEVIDGSCELLSQQLRIGTTDILIGALRSGHDIQDLRTEPLFHDPCAIVGRAGHPLQFSEEGATLAQLTEQQWVAQTSGTPIRAAFDALFKGMPPPKASIETSSLVLTRAIILESDRLSMLSRRQIAVEEGENLLCCIRVSKDAEERLGTRTIGLTTRENWLPSKLQAEFLQYLRSASASFAKETLFEKGLN
jgi:LysR family transcriptional regulator, regulator for genes of the gallate degradation pathway